MKAFMSHPTTKTCSSGSHTPSRPLGALRLTIPQSLNSSFNGTKAATAYYPECVGYGGDDIGYKASEDCLALKCDQTSQLLRPKTSCRGMDTRWRLADGRHPRPQIQSILHCGEFGAHRQAHHWRFPLPTDSARGASSTRRRFRAAATLTWG
jgi:hypothetical protein